MKLATARTGRGTLDVGDDLGGQREVTLLLVGAGWGDADFLVGAGKESVELGGLRGDGGEGAFLGGTFGARVGGDGDGFGACAGHGGRRARFSANCKLWCVSVRANEGEGASLRGEVCLDTLSWGAYDKVEPGWKFRRDGQGCHPMYMYLSIATRRAWKDRYGDYPGTIPS